MNAERATSLPASPDHALRVLAAGSRTFSFAGWFLPADRRRDAATLYAFCRAVDDLADDAPDPTAARVELGAMLRELEGEAPLRPSCAGLADLAARRGLDLRHAAELVRGVSGDLGEVRIADDSALVQYGYRVAGTVGLMMCSVLGVRDPAAGAHAIDLGVGMQLTNICRDVAEDARNGRVYLPQTRLRAAGVPPTPEGVLAGREGVAQVVREVLALADRYYASADAGMRFIPARARFAILVASRVYRAIGTRLLSQGADPLRGRTVVPWTGKLAVALSGARTFLIGGGAAPHDADLHSALVGLPGAHLEPGRVS